MSNLIHSKFPGQLVRYSPIEYLIPISVLKKNKTGNKHKRSKDLVAPSKMEHGDRRNKGALRAGTAGAGGCDSFTG